MKNYQNLNRYNGTIYGDHKANGIEYDWEIPDDVTIGSPGGVSSIHHHYTKGFYGRGNTSSDVYAGQGERYNSGVYGSLYASGHTASEDLGYYPPGPDQEYWNAGSPPHLSGQSPRGNIGLRDQRLGDYSFPEMQSQSRENFTQQDLASQGIELIGPSDDSNSVSSSSSPPMKNRVLNAMLLFVLFIIAVVALSFWTSSSQEFIRQVLHRGKEVSWKALLMYSVILTVIFFLVIWLAGIPLQLFTWATL